MARSEYNFFFPFRVRYAETDGQGIVFYGNYLNFFDTAIYEYLRALPFDYVSYVDTIGADFHIVHVTVDYSAPARFDEIIEAAVRTEKIGTTSLTFVVEIFLSETSKSLTKGQLVWVNTNLMTNRPVPLPDELISRIRFMDGLP